MTFLVVYKNKNCNCRYIIEMYLEGWAEASEEARRHCPDNYNLVRMSRQKEAFLQEVFWKWN